MGDEAGKIDALWAAFRGCKSALTGAADTSKRDELVAILQRIDAKLYLEINAVDGARWELVITAHGKRSLFAQVREIVARAPREPAWTFHALRPKRGFPDSVQWGGETIPLDAVVFEVLRRAGQTGLGLRLHVPLLLEAHKHEALAALRAAIDRGLGEDEAGRSIGLVEVRPLRDASAALHLPALTELPRILARQK